MMEIFELSWMWHEDYTHYLFWHDTKTFADFEKDVKDAFVKYGPEYLAEETGWAGASSWTDFVAKKLPEYGYKPIYTKRVGAWKEFIGQELIEAANKHNEAMRLDMEKDDSAPPLAGKVG